MYLIVGNSENSFSCFYLLSLIWLWRAPIMLDADCGFSILMLRLHKFWWTPKFFGFLQMENWITDFATPIMRVRWISWLWLLFVENCGITMRHFVHSLARKLNLIPNNATNLDSGSHSRTLSLHLPLICFSFFVCVSFLFTEWGIQNKHTDLISYITVCMYSCIMSI